MLIGGPLVESRQRPPPPAVIMREQPRRNQLVGTIVGVGYLGPFIATVGTGVLSRLGLIEAPPLNALTDIANNAMEAEIASGSLQPIVATAWATSFWVDLIGQYYSFDGPGSFLATYCSQHEGFCTGVSF